MVGLSKAELLQKRKPAGRPKVYDPEKIQEEMLEWAKREDSINFAGFCADRGYLPGLIWRLEKEYEDFANTYTLVKMKLAERRERHLNEDVLNYGAWQRYQRGYDPFLNKFEENLENQDAARRKGIAQQEQMNLFTLAKLAAEGKIKQED